MQNTSEDLTTTLSLLLETINDTLQHLRKTSDTTDKQQLADIVKTLCESQDHLARSVDLFDDDFDLFDDDYYDEDDEDELNALMDTKQIQFTRKPEKKKSSKKGGKSSRKPEDDPATD